MTQQDYTGVRSLCKWSSPSSPWLQHWSQEEQSGLKAITEYRWFINRLFWCCLKSSYKCMLLLMQKMFIQLIHCPCVGQWGCASYLICSGGRKSCSSSQRMPVLVQSSPGHSFPGPPLWPFCEPRSWSEQTQCFINRREKQSGGPDTLSLSPAEGSTETQQPTGQSSKQQTTAVILRFHY